jgi:hypothetical protein
MGTNAYFHNDWAENSERANAKLNKELLKCAIAILQSDGHAREISKLFTEIITENPKFKGFYNPDNPSDRATFGALFSDDVKTGNNIRVIKRRPVTFQFQQF